MAVTLTSSVLLCSISLYLLLHPITLSPLIRVCLKINDAIKPLDSLETITFLESKHFFLHLDMEMAIWAHWKWTLTFRWKYLNFPFVMIKLFWGRARREMWEGAKYSSAAQEYGLSIFCSVDACDQKYQDQSATNYCQIWHSICMCFSISCGPFWPLPRLLLRTLHGWGCAWVLCHGPLFLLITLRCAQQPSMHDNDWGICP